MAGPKPALTALIATRLAELAIAADHETGREAATAATGRCPSLKAIRVPSGDHTGFVSVLLTPASCRIFLPFGSTSHVVPPTAVRRG